MGFQTKNESVPLADLELEAQKQRSLDELQQIALKIEEVKKIEAEYTRKSFDIEELDRLIAMRGDELKRLERECDVKQKEFIGLSEQIKKVNTDFESINAAVSSLIETKQSLDEDVRVRKENLEDMTKLGDSVTTKLDWLVTEKNKLEEEMAAMVLSKQDEVEVFDKKINESSRRLVEMGGEIEAMSSDVLELDRILKSKNLELAELENKIQEVERLVLLASQNLEKVTTETEKYREQVEDDLAKREGDVSNKEAWLKEKEELLKRAKSDLELFYNRSINHIKF